MKKLLTVLIGISFVACQANGQNLKTKDVPENVKQAIQTRFNVTKADWEKEDNNYEATFNYQGKETSVVITQSATILEVETEIKKEQLPQAVLEQIKKEFAGYKLSEAARIETDGVITYEAEVKKGKDGYELIFDDKQLLKKKSLESEDVD